MLKKIKISNLSIIDKIELKLAEGLNIITGEKEAGKKIIIEGLNMILGDRADSEMIKSGFDEATIEGYFISDLDKKLIESQKNGQINIKRSIIRIGQDKCFINDKEETLSTIQDIGETLIDLQSQHIHQALLKTSTHIDYLDKLYGDKIMKKRNDFRKHYHKYQRLLDSQKTVTTDLEESGQREDLLKSQIEEIDQAELKVNEEDKLIEEKERLTNIESLKIAFNEVYKCIFTEEVDQVSAYNSLSRAKDTLAALPKTYSEIQDFQEKIESLQDQLENLSSEIKNFLDELQSDPQHFEGIESRLSEIEKLKKKYGPSVEEIMSFKKEVEDELLELTAKEKDPEELAKEIEEEEEWLVENGLKLHSERSKIAFEFEKAVLKQLKDLNMNDARFSVEVIQQPHPEGLEVNRRRIRFFPNGLDAVEFLISTNPGEPLKPLNRIASEGELSRIMLALKIVLTEVDEISSLIFDEIDSGIERETASIVGRKLAKLSKKHQVICITDLPQIACFADYHLKIIQTKKDGRIVTQISELNPEKRIQEIARMLSIERVTKYSIRNAEKLIEEADKTKEKLK